MNNLLKRILSLENELTITKKELNYYKNKYILESINTNLIEIKLKKIFNNINDAIFIHEISEKGLPGKFIEVNNKAVSILKYSSKELLNMTPLNLSIYDDKKLCYKIMENLFSKKHYVFEDTYLAKDKTRIDVEVSSHLFELNNKNFIISIARDITNKKIEQKKLTNIQKERLQKQFPIPDKIDMNILYKPAEIISGDFYHFVKTDNNTVVGILSDICGKGVSAALSISAIKTIFSDYVYINNSPKEILNFLNKKINRDFENEFTAALVFKFEFNNMQAVIAGAGINKFIFKHNDYYCAEELLHGHFLGMFDKDNFEEKIINFNSKDEFHFYSDGFERNINLKVIINILNSKTTMENKINYLESLLNTLKLKDDCTWLAFRIK